MTPITWPREEPEAERLLVVDPASRSFADSHVGDLPGYLRAGDLLVVNDAATLPASLAGKTDAGKSIEVRLVSSRDERTWDAVIFGEGDWRTRTENRPAPPRLAPQSRITFDPDLAASVEMVSPLSPRLVCLRFDRGGAPLWSALYRVGRPVQYAHVDRALELWHTQTHYASRPWAVELPSAGRPLTWQVLRALENRGVTVAPLTHAAGLSSTGDWVLDAALPFPERYDIPARTVDAIRDTKSRDGRVIAVGTTVVRALEGAAASNGGVLRPGQGTTDILLGPRTRLRVIDGLFTGLHESSTSHFRLLQAFASAPVLTCAYAHAERAGYHDHEFGDSSLILAHSLPPPDAAAMSA